jgi:glucokinase
LTDYILAIEIGGTKLQMAVGLSDGTILYNHRQKVNPAKGNEGILNSIFSALPLFHSKASEMGGSVATISIGFGGPVDTIRGIVIDSFQVTGWNNFPLREYVSKKANLPVYVFNDTNAATWGEYCKGTGKGSKIFFYTNIGSGIGGGVVIDGKLYDGQGYGAVEFGQVYMFDPWSKDKFPVNTIEKICSGWAIEKRLRNCLIPRDSLLWELCENKQETLDCRMLEQAVKTGDVFATKEFDLYCDVFSIALSGVVSFFNPDRIAIGGGVSRMGDILISRLCTKIPPYIFISGKNRFDIVQCQLDEDIVLVGALLLINEGTNK